MLNPALVAGAVSLSLAGLASGIIALAPRSSGDDLPDTGDVHQRGTSEECPLGGSVTAEIDVRDSRFGITGRLKDFEQMRFVVETPAGDRDLDLAVNADVDGEYLAGDWMNVKGAIARDGQWVASRVARPCVVPEGVPDAEGETFRGPGSDAEESPRPSRVPRSPSSATPALVPASVQATAAPVPAAETPAPTPCQAAIETPAPTTEITASPTPPPTPATTPTGSAEQ
jgi:hypothetical protein